MKDEDRPRLGRVRSKHWVPVAHGLYRPDSPPCGLHDDLLAWKLVLPSSGAFTHLTAAAEYGWWLPPVPDDLPIFAAICRAESRPQRPGLRVTRHREAPPVLLRDEVPLVVPAEAILACAVDLGLLDLVVLCDAALQLGGCTLSDLEQTAGRHRRGAPMLRRVLPWVDARSESAWETLLRVLHVVCDVPVEPQFEVYDEHGMFLARGDLRIDGTNVLHEYDGGAHLEVRRQRRDLARARRLDEGGWIRRGYTSIEVLHQANLILRDADRSLGRPHRPERIRAWYALLGESLFTPSGTERFRRRLGLPPSPGAVSRGA